MVAQECLLPAGFHSDLHLKKSKSALLRSGAGLMTQDGAPSLIQTGSPSIVDLLSCVSCRPASAAPPQGWRSARTQWLMP